MVEEDILARIEFPGEGKCLRLVNSGGSGFSSF